MVTATPVIHVTAASDNLTAIATLVLAGITLGLAAATVALVLVTRAGTAQVRADARRELSALERQIGAGYRPLLVDVLPSGPVPVDMGAQEDVKRNVGPHETKNYPGPTVETKLPEIPVELIDPRSVFVRLHHGQKIYLSIPLRNVGHGLAVIDGGGVELTGPYIGQLEHRTIQRYHVPVGETTRVDLIAPYASVALAEAAARETGMYGTVWELTVPYCDFAGDQRTLAQLQLVCRNDYLNGPWLVERVTQEAVATPTPQPSTEKKGFLWRLLYGPNI